MILDKIIAIVSFYKVQIRDIIKDIKSYYVIMLLGTAIIILAILSLLKVLGSIDTKNFSTIVGSVVSVIGSFMLNLYFSNIDKIRTSNKKRLMHKKRLLNYYQHRHSTEADVQENVQKEYIKITFEAKIE